jgi:hypothetical protein
MPYGRSTLAPVVRVAVVAVGTMLSSYKLSSLKAHKASTERAASKIT